MRLPYNHEVRRQGQFLVQYTLYGFDIAEQPF